jgi:hypothetical protein
VLLCLAVAPAIGSEAPFFEPNAVLINITEEDLNRIALDAFHARGASRIEGEKQRLSRGLSELHYRAGLSEPIVTLGRDGRLRLDFDIVEGELRIGSLERKLLMRRMRCEDAGVSVDPDEPVALTLAVRLAIEDHDLRLVPEEVRLANTRGFQLQKPARCRNNPLPEFLLWWIGKGRLRRKIEQLDDVLLAKARDGAAALNEDQSLLAKYWQIGGDRKTVHLYPHTIDTSRRSLLIGLAGASPLPRADAAPAPGWVSTLSDRSFLGLSESFMNFALRAAFREIDGRPREPSGGLRKLLRSESVYALIPGMRGVASREALRIGLAFHASPEIEIAAADEVRGSAGGQGAVIRIGLSDVEMILWESDGESEQWLGSVDIDSARIAVAPYHNVLGGVSFHAIENIWRVSSRGIEFDEQVLAAVFQELLFGEIFETRYEPVGRESFDVGETRFSPRYFNLVGSHLVIGLTGY